MILLLFATYYIGKANGALGKISGGSYKVDNMVVAVLADDGADKIEDAASYTFGVQYAMSGDDVRSAVADINEKLGTEIQTVEYRSLSEQAQALHDGQVQAIIYNEGYTGILEEAFENQEVLTAKVAQVLDGGLSVEVEGSRVFIPASLVSDTYEKDLSKYAGQEIQFVITEFNPKRRRIIGDRKQLLVTEKAKLKEELFSKIQVGDKVEGTVKNVTDFGAFIDLGGADGLLHISEMSWGRVENPKKVFKSGDKVTVLIKDIQGEKIALSLKFPEANPWAHAAEKYAAGSVVTGRVARMTDFGAFVELEPGVDALLHVSQISREHIEKPADVLKIGQEIEAKVVDFNEDDHKISLSVKALQAAPQNEDVADVDIDSYAK